MSHSWPREVYIPCLAVAQPMQSFSFCITSAFAASNASERTKLEVRWARASFTASAKRLRAIERANKGSSCRRQGYARRASAEVVTARSPRSAAANDQGLKADQGHCSSAQKWMSKVAPLCMPSKMSDQMIYRLSMAEVFGLKYTG